MTLIICIVLLSLEAVAARTPVVVTPGKGTFDPVLAHRLIYYSASAYAPPEQVLAWRFPNPELNGNLSATFQPLMTFKSNYFTSDAFAFLGVDNVKQELIVAFKGTNGTLDILHDIVDSLDSVFHYSDPCTLSSGQQYNIHKGFCWYYSTLIEVGLVTSFFEVYRKYPSYRVIATGHSLGAALAAIFAADVASSPANDDVRLHLYAFGSPRVGDTGFAAALNALPVDSWRVVHWKDVITHLAPCCSGFWGTNICDATMQGCPYHYGGEAWFPADMELPPVGICSSGENTTSCSGSVGIDLYEGVWQHLKYYGLRVGRFSKTPSEALALEAQEIADFLAAAKQGRHRIPLGLRSLP